MTDKPDVAALVAKWREYRVNRKSHGLPIVSEFLDDIEVLASELTRLAAGRVELDRLWTIKHDIAEKAEAEVARLRDALTEYVYETTHLSPERDGFHHCRIPNALLEKARAALKPDTGE